MLKLYRICVNISMGYNALMFDLKPTLFNKIVFNKIIIKPELRFTTKYENDTWKFEVENISKFNAYDIKIFAYEDLQYETSLNLIGQLEGILKPKEKRYVSPFSSTPFKGCLSYTEFRVEFTSSDGNHFVYSSGSGGSGIEISNFKRIRKRTDCFKNIVHKKSLFKLWLSSVVYKIRFKLKI